MHQIYDVWNSVEIIKACVHYFCFCYQNESLGKSSKMIGSLEPLDPALKQLPNG